MNCNEALEILSKPNHTKRQVALTYIRNHPNCLARVDQLARTIATEAEDELSCAEAQVQLADYHVVEQAGQDVAQRFPFLHTHLNRCPYCQAEYAALTTAMETYNSGTLPTITAPNPWELDFLEELPPIWSIDGIIRKLTQQIAITITQTEVILDSLALQLVPDIHATAMRGDDDIRYTVLSIPDETAAIRFHFDIKPTPNGMANITLCVTQSATDEPLPDLRIALQTTDGTLVTRSLTDHAGKLELPQMSTGDYIIQARNENDQWEIPLTIMLVD